MNTPNHIRFFELVDSAAKLAFGILCLEALVYLAYLFYTQAEVAPLLSYIRPAFKNIFTLPGMLLVAVGGIMTFKD